MLKAERANDLNAFLGVWLNVDDRLPGNSVDRSEDDANIRGREVVAPPLHDCLLTCRGGVHGPLATNRVFAWFGAARSL